MTLNKLFKFPIVMIDGDNEDRKARTSEGLGLDNEQDADLIMGEAECPYYDFVSVTDRWLPTDDSFNLALDGNFQACAVLFSNSGSFIVPWNKKKFKRELQKFIDSLPKEKVQVSMISNEELKKIINESELPQGD